VTSIRSTPNSVGPTINHAADLLDRLHNINNYVRHHLKMASDRIKLLNCAGYYECDDVWLYLSARTKEKSPELQSAWEGSYRAVTRMKDVLYIIQRNPKLRMTGTLGQARTLSENH
jgi:hypothetical protein